MAKQAKSYLVAVLSMVLGTMFVFALVIVINNLGGEVERKQLKDGAQVAFERKEPPPKPKPKPKPPERKQPTRQPPAPLTGLGSSISGLDFGLPSFDMSGLNDFGDDLLGGDKDVVMTDESVDVPPRATQQAAMAYPPRARSQGVEGYVTLSLLIDESGNIQQVKVLEAKPQGVFEEVAKAGVQQWQFDPAKYKGEPVKVWATQRVTFDLS